MLKDAGVTITIASPKGGMSPIDPRSATPANSTEATKRFYADADAQKALNTTLLINNINPNDYDAVYYPGGHGPMWDMPENKYSIKIIESMYRAGKPIAFVCHAPVALKNVKAKDGSFLLKGRKIAGFSNDEEITGKTQADIPYLLEDMLKGRGANYVSGPNWKSFVVEDGLLISGQNPASSVGVAEKLMTALTASKAKK
jgi:putative intracellular protease/amidase